MKPSPLEIIGILAIILTPLISIFLPNNLANKSKLVHQNMAYGLLGLLMFEDAYYEC